MMESLPDDMLLLILRLLDLRQLLLARAVCRRWRDLALEPTLWRHRELAEDLRPGRGWLLLHTVLSLAPCLRALHLRSDYARVLSDIARKVFVRGFCPVTTWRGADLDLLAVQTNCSVKSLILDAADVSRANQILRRQVALGRLSEVQLSSSNLSSENVNGFPGLLLAVCDSGLKKLSISSCFSLDVDDDQASLAFGRTTPSLLFLQHSRCSPRDGVPALFLRAHAATLVEVDLRSESKTALPPFSGFPALPSLLRLVCPLLRDMLVLLQSRRLESLELDLNLRDEEQARQCLLDAAAFLRQATWLKTLTFSFARKCLLSAAALDMVSAIGHSGRAELELLGVVDAVFGQPPVLAASVAACVRGLPRLHSLYVHSYLSSCDLLAVLLPAAAAAPRLEVLELHLQGMKMPGRCLHAWSHRDDLRDALRRNPGLHLRLYVSPKECCNVPAPGCGACAQGCHPEVVKTSGVGLYAHPDGPQPCKLHRKPDTWVRLQPGGEHEEL